MALPRLTSEEEWAHAATNRRMLPGWMISVLVHAGLYALIVLTLPRGGLPDGDNEPFREVGLEARQPAANDAVAVTATAPDAVAQAAADPLLDTLPPTDAPPLPLQLPTVSTLGPGLVVPSLTTPAGSKSTAARAGLSGAPLRTVGGAPTGRGARGQGTSFLGLAAEGKSFLYLIDKSASMGEHNSIGVARAELMASLEHLDTVQQYQIIFYDNDVHPLKDHDGKRQIFFATDVNRTWTRSHVSSYVPSGGTLHKPALLYALGFTPDVLFFLSDGDTPPLFAADLLEIQKRNRGRTQIQVIEFGEGAKITPGNWLEQLARQNNGQYRYRDVAGSAQP